MTTPAWLIQIFEMTDAAARDVIADLLVPKEGLVVEATQSGPDHFLIVQSHDEEQAATVARMVFASDQHAILLHTSQGPPPPFELVPYISNPGPRGLRLVADDWAADSDDDILGSTGR